MMIINATAHRKAIVLIVVVRRVDSRGIKVQVVPIGGTISSRRPIIAVGTLIVQSPTTVVGVARELPALKWLLDV
ncbi:hypothetical protein IJJ27_01900 [bacterium]|nr:hypothetical protein [bacterium]